VLNRVVNSAVFAWANNTKKTIVDFLGLMQVVFFELFVVCLLSR